MLYEEIFDLTSQKPGRRGIVAPDFLSTLCLRTGNWDETSLLLLKVMEKNCTKP